VGHVVSPRGLDGSEETAEENKIFARFPILKCKPVTKKQKLERQNKRR